MSAASSSDAGLQKLTRGIHNTCQGHDLVHNSQVAQLAQLATTNAGLPSGCIFGAWPLK